MNRTVLATALLTLAAGSARAELLSFGLKAGVPLTDAFNISTIPGTPAFFNENRRFTVGPVVELHLPAGIGIEADALYKSVEFRQTPQGTASGTAWDFPLLLKYRFPTPVVKPMLEAGASFRRFSDLTGVVTLHPQNTVSPGIVLGGGVEVKALIIRLSGELRYTRFFSNGVVSGPLESNKNQAEVLFGITF